MHPDPSRYRLGLHIAPKEGWINDPNGLCQFRGSYHAYFQYNPEWPERDTKHWRHFVSTDLFHWHDEGTALVTDIPEDRSGVYSGSAYVAPGMAPDGGDLMCLYYTGNVVYPGGVEAGYDYVHTGREANEILVTTDNGVDYSMKHVLLRNSDYPNVCTEHVRDPKVWEQDGKLYMLLGARDLDDEGFCLLYESADGVEWSIKSQIYSQEQFGFMWECPNIVQIAGHDFLAVCPQGLKHEALRWQNRWQSGYFPLPASIMDTVLIDQETFVEWDHGYDFYAPQTFVDDAGRNILIGWMGSFDKEWTAVPYGLDWCHCLTVPRELSVAADGRLRQWPVAELASLRGEKHELTQGDTLTMGAYLADIELKGIAGTGALTLDDTLEISFGDGLMTVRFCDEAVAAGRPQRQVPMDTLSDLRVIVDTSAIEIYANYGAEVFSTRWFPEGDALSVRSTFATQAANVWPLENALANAFV